MHVLKKYNKFKVTVLLLIFFLYFISTLKYFSLCLKFNYDVKNCYLSVPQMIKLYTIIERDRNENNKNNKQAFNCARHTVIFLSKHVNIVYWSVFKTALTCQYNIFEYKLYLAKHANKKDVGSNARSRSKLLDTSPQKWCNWI